MVLFEAHGFIWGGPTKEAKGKLQSIPWAAKLLADPNLRSFTLPSIEYKPSTEDAMVAVTLKTDKTVSLWQPLYRAPCPEAPLGEFLFILTLGPGLNGHPNILHGGMTSLLFDEVLGHAVGYHKDHGYHTFTATLTVDYKKPVPTPQTVLFRTVLEPHSSGRKSWVTGTLEDGEGTIYANGKALFISVKSKSPRL
jgi:thioesterase superfamily protein 4